MQYRSGVANDLREMVRKQQEQLRDMQGVGNAGGEPVSPSIALQPRRRSREPAGFQALASIRQSQVGQGPTMRQALGSRISAKRHANQQI